MSGVSGVEMRGCLVAVMIVGLGASALPAEAQFYSYSRSSYYSSGVSSTLAGNSREEGGRIVRGYYNRYGQVIAKVTQKGDDTARPVPVDAAAAATTYETGAKPVRRQKRASATAQR
jgi:hypothetical protein